jgi:hypothetical protein
MEEKCFGVEGKWFPAVGKSLFINGKIFFVRLLSKQRKIVFNEPFKPW